MGVRAKAHTVKPKNPALGQAAPEVEGEEAMSVAERERLAGKQSKLASQEEGLRQVLKSAHPVLLLASPRLAPLPSSAKCAARAQESV